MGIPLYDLASTIQLGQIRFAVWCDSDLMMNKVWLCFSHTFAICLGGNVEGEI